VEKPLTGNMRADGKPLSLAEYEEKGGYRALRQALNEMTPADVQRVVTESGLRGRGGAGFVTGQKWSFVPMGEGAPHPKFLISNSDEMEPGAFKDRLLMEGNPHQLIEGMIITAYAIEAEIAYVFLRWEYQESAVRIAGAIKEAYGAGYLGKDIMGSGFSLEMRMHTSAGRYICGEETALLNALEGKRGVPRNRPPYPQAAGLWGYPTVVNNAETLSNISHILRNGPEWYRKISRSEDGGTKIYTVSGRVNNPGAWELPMGTTIRELLARAGGMREGFTFRAVIPGGASTEFVPEEDLDVAMDYDSLRKAGSRLGTGTMIVLDDKTCPIGMVHNIEKFFARESCGWCTPCREGLPWIERMLRAFEEGDGRMEEIDLLQEQAALLAPGRTFCVFAPGAMEPLQSALKYFRGDFEAHVAEKGCSYRRETGRL
jgi:NADH-quinone oxidoreductase subunit F